MSPRRIAYVVASYPHGTGEPFVRPEVEWMAVNGVEVTLVPVHPRGPQRAKADLPRRVSLVVRPLASVDVLLGALVSFVQRPFVTTISAARLVFGVPLGITLRNLAVLPKALWLGRELRRLRTAHVHAYWASTPATVAMIAAAYAEIPWSFTAHRWDLLEPNALDAKLASCSFARVTSAEGIERARCQVDPQLASRLVLEYTGMDVPASIATPSSAPRLSMLCPALLIERKDHATLLRGVADAHRRGADVELQLAGSGPLDGELRRLATELGIASRVRFLGQLGHADLLRRYECSSVDCVALTSLDEGLPFGLLEAMARGVPTIGADVGGVAELINLGGGVLVEPGSVRSVSDAILEMADPARRSKLAAEARATVEANFDQARQVRRLLELMLQDGT